MIIIVEMTSDTGVWGVVIITVMTCCTLIGNGCMCSVEGIILVVNIE